MEIIWKKIDSDTCVNPREGQCSCVTENSMYMFGGVLHTDDLIETNDLLRFSLEKSRWEKLAVHGDPPPPRAGSTLVAVGGFLYLFGGISHSEGWLNDQYKFDTERKTWSVVKANGTVPSRRDKLQGVAIGQLIYYFGGFGPKSAGLEEDDEDEEWEDEESNELPSDQEGAEFGWFNDLYVFDTGSAAQVSNVAHGPHVYTLWAQDTCIDATDKWSQPVQMNLGVPTARAAHAMCAVGNQLVIFGGKDIEARQNDIHIFNTETKKWNTEMNIQGKKPEARSFHCAVSIGSKLVVVGGRGTLNQHFADIHVFDCESQTWSEIKQNGVVPEGRSQQALGVIGDTVIMFGGTANFCPELNACLKFFTDTYTFNTDAITKFQRQT